MNPTNRNLRPSSGLNGGMVRDSGLGIEDITGYLLRRVQHLYQIYALGKIRIGDLSITPTQSGMIVTLHERGAITQAELATLMNLRSPTVLQLVAQLEEMGFVRRAPHKVDGRSHSLKLTTLGESAVPTIREFSEARDHELLSVLSSEEREQLRGLLRRIINANRGKDFGRRTRLPHGHLSAALNGDPAALKGRRRAQ